ncbi:6PGD fold domain-containing protein [Corynebacterium cystitidis]|uniref:6PGD fold domain-containing protein n=1 Tax=Corynebacterium cystitidis TaxID=35757 RepID=UPI00211EE000|nr:hypothetical protein [Corynebacterium cystitidis]
MSAPRLNVGVIGGQTLANELESAGHTITCGIDPDDSGLFDLVVIDVDEGLEQVAEAIAPHARHGQMYLHTSLEAGVQVLDPIEVSGAIVLAAHDIGDNKWLTAATDELGETIIELLVGEFGGTSIPVSDAQRLTIRTALEYHDLAVEMHHDARAMLVDTLDNPELAEVLIPADSSPLRPIVAVEEYDQMHRTIADTGRAHMFASLVRRHAELRNNQDLELWAISQLDYKE